MDKKQLILSFIDMSMSKGKKYSFVDAKNIVDNLISVIQDNLSKDGDYIRIVGFGTLKVVKKKARVGRNPNNGESISIPSSLDVKFSTGLLHKKSINKK